MSQGAPGGPPIARIAVAPALGSVDEQIAFELQWEGYRVVDPSATTRLLASHHLGGVLLDTREALEALTSEGVDALLMAVSEYPGYVLHSKGVDVDFQPPEKVAVRLIRTTSGEVVIAFVWENAFCPLRGSPCDNRAKRPVSEAAGEVADVVIRSISPAPAYLIEATADGGTLVIGGVRFKKKSDCPGFALGQRVKFTAGDARGLCAVAKVVLTRSGEECDVECPPTE